MKKIQILLTVFVLSVFSSLFFVGVFLVPPDTVLSTEMRKVASFPHFERSAPDPVKAFFHALDSYIADRLLCKEMVFKQVTALYSRYFYQYETSRTVRGIDGWLFLGNNYGEIVDKHIKNFPGDIARTEAQVKECAVLKAQAVKNGAAYAVLICPDKHGIYYEYLPKYLRLGPHTRYAARVMPRFEAYGLAALDLFDAVSAQKDTAILYQKMDTHWNMKGAEVGFLAAYAWLQESILKRPLKKTLEYSLVLVPSRWGDLVGIGGYYGLPIHDGDLYQIVTDNAPVFWEENGTKIQDTVARSVQGAIPHYKASMQNKNAKNAMRLVIICDSFFTPLAPFFNLTFSDILYISQGASLQDKLKAIDEFKPDLVLFETVERSL